MILTPLIRSLDFYEMNTQEAIELPRGKQKFNHFISDSPRKPTKHDGPYLGIM